MGRETRAKYRRERRKLTPGTSILLGWCETDDLVDEAAEATAADLTRMIGARASGPPDIEQYEIPQDAYDALDRLNGHELMKPQASTSALIQYEDMRARIAERGGVLIVAMVDIATADGGPPAGPRPVQDPLELMRRARAKRHKRSCPRSDPDAAQPGGQVPCTCRTRPARHEELEGLDFGAVAELSALFGIELFPERRGS